MTAMSIINSCASTYRSDAVTSDGMLSMERNCESTKGSVRADSLESAKISVSRASDSSGLSDDSNWSNITGVLISLIKEMILGGRPSLLSKFEMEFWA